MMTDRLLPIPKQILEAVREHQCVLYAGAGFSLEARLPDGERLPTGAGLGQRLAKELFDAGHRAKEPQEGEALNFADMAEDYETAFGRQRLIALLLDIYAPHGLKPAEAHHRAIKFFPTIVTTNYDSLFEQASWMSGITPLVIRRDKQLAFAEMNDRLKIIKIHGDFDDPEQIIISGEDYRRNPLPEGLREKLQSIFTEKTVLFVGCGLADSDLQEVYYTTLDRLDKLKPRSFVVTPFPAEDAPERRQWDLFRKRWEQRGMEFISAKAGEFLQQLDDALSEKQTVAVAEEKAAQTGDAQALLEDYRKALEKQVSTVKLFGEDKARPLKDMFVELSVIEDYRPPADHAEFLSLLDSRMQRRRTLFERQEDSDERSEAREKVKRIVKSDELLHRKTQAVITGMPGGGKTTLLRYLAFRILEENKRLPIFLELKTLTQKDFADAGNQLAELLFEKGIAALLDPPAAFERQQLKEAFFARLKAGEAVVFLDGLDEVSGQADLMGNLCQSLNQFLAANHKENIVIISTRPYALKEQFGNLQKMEIEPLSNHQKESLLKHYYPDNAEAIIKALHGREDLRDMTQSPFLLGVIAGLYLSRHQVVANRLELYEQIVLRLVDKLDQDKSVPQLRFHIGDEGGLLKRDFLKWFACERLLVDKLKSQSNNSEAARLVFTREEMVKKAKQFTRRNNLSAHINPYELAADVIATPLLREVGLDAYSFVHLTIGEYLAAKSLAERNPVERKKIFFQTYFDTTLVEMEVLPMAIGLIDDTDELYEEIERLPDSLTFAGLRLRARGLTYGARISEKQLELLIERLVGFIKRNQNENVPYEDIVIKSFVGIQEKSLEILNDFSPYLLTEPRVYDRLRIAKSLGQIGVSQGIDILVEKLNDANFSVRQNALDALTKVETLSAENALIEALQNKINDVRAYAAIALGKLGVSYATKDLIKALKDEDSLVRWRASYALEKVGREDAEADLIEALDDKHDAVSHSVIMTLGSIGTEKAKQALIKLFETATTNPSLRWAAIQQLGQLGMQSAIEHSISVLKVGNDTERGFAAYTLGQIASVEAIEPLLEALKDGEGSVRGTAIEALGHIKSKRVVEALIEILKDQDKDARMKAAKALGQIKDERAQDSLIEALRDQNEDVRKQAALALGFMKAKSAIDPLMSLLKDGDSSVRAVTSQALGLIGTEKIINSLIAVSKDHNEQVRYWSAAALGELRSAHGISRLIEFLTDKEIYIRSRAAESLAKVKDEELTKGLVITLSQENDFARQKAAQVVGYYSHDPQLLEELSRLATTDPRNEVRSTASEAQEKFLRKLQLFYNEADVIAEAEEKERAKTLEENRAFIAHELKNTLVPLASFASFLKENIENNENDKEKLRALSERIIKQTHLAYNVVERFVEYSRPLVPRFNRTDINALLTQCTDEMSAQCESNNIQIISHFVQTATSLVDTELIRQVFHNALLNAIEAIDQDGIITIKTEREPKKLLITINDTGRGIPAEYLNRVFDLGVSTKAGNRGTGMGLAFARRIIEEGHRGQIQLESKGDDKGATLIIELPIFEEGTQNGK